MVARSQHLQLHPHLRRQPAGHLPELATCCCYLLLLCAAVGTSRALTLPSLCSTPLVQLPVDGRTFCRDAGISGPNSYKCMLLHGLASLFPQGEQLASEAAAECAAVSAPSPTLTRNGEPIRLTLTDQRPLPPVLNATLLASEGATYTWWWRQVANFGRAAVCVVSPLPRQHPLAASLLEDWWVLPAGWRLHSVLWSSATSQQGAAASSQQGGGGGPQLPLAGIITDGAVVGIVIRGTRTYADWLTDLSYTQGVLRGADISLPGQTHEGFARLAAHLWLNGVQAAVDELVLPPLENSGSTLAQQRGTSIIISAHSLGAAVGTLLAHRLQAYLVQHGSAVRVDAILFAPPNVGNAAFAAAFGDSVNARRLSFEADIVPQLPCSPTVTACVQAWPGALPVAAGVWEYQPTPGTLVLAAGSMPAQPAAWASLGHLDACQLSRYFLATHSCAYECFFSQYVVPADARAGNSCLLWAPADSGDAEKDGTTGASMAEGRQLGDGFCESFPTAPPQARYPVPVPSHS